ncbi:serine--glyoxylate aminotransferase-like [Miscanthus floridulus]|uniref:serine--glyoxylate aminotransferase-like n=1 Tax=Miscanthus floridulus TaxID=154761 RepID=UPI00345A964C
MDNWGCPCLLSVSWLANTESVAACRDRRERPAKDLRPFSVFRIIPYDLIFEEGLDNVIKRHNRLGTATRFAVEAWGLKNCCQKEECFSDTVTAVVVPPYIDSAEIVKHAWKRYNLSLGLGLNKVAGKVFRIGHFGNLNELQLLGCLSGVEMVLKDVGYPVKLGSGVAAAAAYLLNSTPLIPSRI